MDDGPFKITMHLLTDTIQDGGKIIDPSSIGTAERDMNELHKTYLLHESRIVNSGEAILCVWYKPASGMSMPLGFQVL